MKKNRSNRHLHKRYIKEQLFKIISILSIATAICVLVCLLYSIFQQGYKSFYTNTITLDLNINDTKNKNFVNYDQYIQNAFKKLLKTYHIKDSVDTYDVISTTSKYYVENLVKKEKLSKISTIDLKLVSELDIYLKKSPGYKNNISEQTLNILNILKYKKIIRTHFNTQFFTNSDSRFPELAGIKGAFWGSIYTISLTILFSIIISVGASIYLEEFAPKNKITNFIEININNLASIPSVIFGMLGLIIFQKFFHIPRATPLLASLVLTLMSLPTIIISVRLSIQSVPKTLKESVYGLGANRLQYIKDHLIPYTLPSMITGIIISISRAIGETAPLLMIGMISFINIPPNTILDKSSTFPVQILLWFTAPEAGFIEKASATIILLLLLLISINGVAIYLRNKFER